MRLNEQSIRKIAAPETGNRVVWDDELTGLGLRTTSAGAKAFVLRYVIDGRERRMTLGAWPEWTTTKARKRAGDLRQDIDAGNDPLAAKAQRRTDPTFGELASEYFQTEAANQRRKRDYEATLKRDVLPYWGKLKARDIKRREVIALIERKAVDAPIAANRVFELVRRIFNFAIRRDIIEASPCVQVKKPGVERSKERVLSREEIAALWGALDGPHFTNQTAAALRLILATAQRPGEVCGMRWADVDSTEHVWTIPGASSKNTLAHRVPLNATSRDILDSLPRDGEHVFPKSWGAGHIEPNTLGQAVRKALKEPTEAEAKKLKRALREPIPVGKFAAHDLRRTAASMMASAGVQRFIIGRVLNHTEPGITRVYDRHGYDSEKRTALDTWDRLLRAVVAGEAEKSNVVEIGGRA